MRGLGIGRWVSGHTEVEGVEAVVAGHGTVEVLGGGGARKVVGAGSGGHRHASTRGAGGDATASDGSLKSARLRDTSMSALVEERNDSTRA